MKFDDVFDIIILQEGGYSYDPDDRGGETKYGISKRAFPYVDIKNLTFDMAKDIYFNHYWTPAKCEQIPESLRLIHFSCAVNCGVRSANIILQQSTNSKIAIDGIVGNQTLSHLKHSSPMSYSYYWLSRYVDIVGGVPNQIKFLNGWNNRIKDCIKKTL